MSKFRSDLMNREANYFETTTRYDLTLHFSTISESIFHTCARDDNIQ